MKTKYEELVEQGKLPPLTGMDIAFIDELVYEVVKKGFCTEEEKELLTDVLIEIEYIYKDDQDYIEVIKMVLNK